MKDNIISIIMNRKVMSFLWPILVVETLNGFIAAIVFENLYYICSCAFINIYIISVYVYLTFWRNIYLTLWRK